MSRTVTLPSGATAVLKEADDVNFGDREDVLNMFQAELGAALGGGGAAAALASLGGGAIVKLQRALITMAVEEWTITDRKTGEVLPIPSVEPDALRKVPIQDGAKLFAEAQGLRDLVFPNFEVTPEADTPTGSSDVSATR